MEDKGKAEGEKKWKEWIRKIIRDEIKARLERPSHKDEVGELGGTKVPCDFLLEIPQTIIIIWGDELIKKYWDRQEEFKHPPVFIKDYECEEVLKKLGIKEKGVFLLDKKKKLKKLENL